MLAWCSCIVNGVVFLYGQRCGILVWSTAWYSCMVNGVVFLNSSGNLFCIVAVTYSNGLASLGQRPRFARPTASLRSTNGLASLGQRPRLARPTASLGGKPRFQFLRFRFLRFLIKPQAVRFLIFRFGFHGSGSVCEFPVNMEPQNS